MTTHHNDSIGRRSRLRATATGKRVSPTKRDMLWFSRLAEHGPLPSSFLLAFSAQTHLCDKRARERLTDLFHEDNTPDGGPYLIRPPQQFRTIDSRYNQLVYDLAPAGWRCLRRLGLHHPQRSKASGPWLHRFMTSCITASIEITTLARDDLSYIPQSAILARAEADLRYAVIITDPANGWRGARDLIPDALFGLRYHGKHGDRFRFFVVEADRATEPMAASHWHRKGFERNLAQYEAYIAGGAYREHLHLTAPLLVLNVLSDARRMARMVEFTAKRSPEGNASMLFQTWLDFGPVYRPPEPNRDLLADAWSRGGTTPFRIGIV